MEILIDIDLLDERVTNCSDFITFPTISQRLREKNEIPLELLNLTKR